MEVLSFSLSNMGTNSYLCTEGKDALLIDAPHQNEVLIRAIKEKGLALNAILLTHGHFDHVMGLRALLDEFPEAKVYIAKEDSYLVQKKGEGNREIIGSILPSFYAESILKLLDSLPEEYNYYEDEILGMKVIKSPGHTEGSVSLYSEKERILFTGDTIFKSSFGRTDFPKSSEEKLFLSIRNILEIIPDDVRILPGHGKETTIKAEKAFYGLS